MKGEGSKLQVLKVRIRRKSIGNKLILEDVEFGISRGIVLVKGANGSGKTTLLRILAGLDRFFVGEVLLGDSPTFKVKESISYLGHRMGIYMDFTVKENLEFFSHIYSSSYEHALRLASKLALDTYMNYPCYKLSRGNLQKLGIVRTFLKDARMYVLDEPTTSLDLHAKRVFLDMLSHMKDRIVVVSTHADLEIEHALEVHLKGHKATT